MSGNSLRPWLKWIWITIVLAFVAYYVIGRREFIQSAVASIPASEIAVAVLLLVAGKICLGEIMRHAAAAAGIELKRRESFRIYNLTQLAKYVPGSIWQFVGRIAILRERGVSMSGIRDSILVEQVWVLTSALIVGVSLAGLHGIVSPELPLLPSNEPYWAVGLVALALTGLAFLLGSKIPAALRDWIWRLWPTAPAATCMALSWICFGLAFYVTLPSFGFPEGLWYYAIGAYALGYVAGLVVPFAPAGLGVRDAFLAMAVAPFTGFDAAVVLAGLNRIIYVGCELALAAIAMQIRMRAPA